MNLQLISELIGLIVPMLGALTYVIRKTVATQSRLEQLEKEVDMLKNKKDHIADVCRHGRIAIHEEVKALAREVSVMQGRLG
tara:strand:+ start:80 stop:325 length:246 start_codon:yes stop_codon:yes gene_type:complete